MAWFLLVLGGLMEVGWAAVMPATRGFSRPGPTVAFIVLLVGSMVLLERAQQHIPLGTAYSVWVGIGAVGATIAGILLYEDPVTVARIGFMALLIVSILGLKLSGG